MQQIIFKNFLFIISPLKNHKLNVKKKNDRSIELSFYEQLSVIKTDQAFSGYEMSYKVKIIERKDPVL